MLTFAIMALASLLPQTEQKAATVVWLQTDWAPHQIVEGPFQGQGTFDVLQQRLTALLPQYQHQLRLTSLGRIESYFLNTDETVCATGALYTEERSKTRFYSLPLAVGPGFAINYVAGSFVESLLDQQWQLDLRKLVQHPELLGAYQPNRHYPEVMLQAITQSGAALLASAFTSELNAAALLLSKRVDYVIEYPERLQFYQRTLKAQQIIKSAAMLDAKPQSVSYITCNKTVLAENLINDINKVIPDLWLAEDYADVLFFWLDENAIKILMPTFESIREQMAEKNRL
ncbi:hypothetical protein GCM10010919_30030 [Alishewanella longhuensis]|uniref:TIGR02285 family protein n=1 Tax=Alishewanella longhuensis TaxID=1091037 RepID=A0ABQ3L123_9ALTE|nr:hypothetical protein [Alishewanella longhuensis]GHG75654.1 hypothetical protein GCM10010919_30030 [Alishewanella longhuensis]